MHYFVVYLNILKRNVILPASWIQNIDIHYEKFINNGLNSSQTYRCFHTTNEDAFIEGRPDGEYHVDFSLRLIEEGNLENYEGCFLGKIKKFKRSYDDAVEYMERRRNQPPALYNENRLNEQPIPDVRNDPQEPDDNIDGIGQFGINHNVGEIEENQENDDSENDNAKENSVSDDGNNFPDGNHEELFANATNEETPNEIDPLLFTEDDVKLEIGSPIIHAVDS